MDIKKLIALVGVGLVALLIYSSVYFVDEREQAIVFRLGKIVEVVTEPGLNLKRPLFDTVVFFDKRLLTHDAEPEQILTGEKKQVEVDYFVKWRVVDVEKYFLTYGSAGLSAALVERKARSQLGDIIKDTLQAQLGDRTIESVVWKERDITSRRDASISPASPQKTTPQLVYITRRLKDWGKPCKAQ